MVSAEPAAALRPLLGEPLVDIGRVVDLVWLYFGTPAEVLDDAGARLLVSRYSLQLQCPCRLSMHDEPVLASQDIFYPANDGAGADFRWDTLGANWFDARLAELRAFLDSRMPTVSHVAVSDHGDVRLECSHGLLLEAFPAASFPRDHWRFYARGQDTPRCLFGPHGYDVPPRA